MKKEIREFYNSKGLQTEKLIKKHKHGLPRQYIEIGMKKIYRQFNDEPIDDLRIARAVWREAERAQAQGFEDTDLEYEEKFIEKLSQERDDYRDKFYGVLLAVAAILCLLAANYVEGII